MRIFSVLLISVFAVHCKSSEVSYFQKDDINRQTFNSIIEGELIAAIDESETDKALCKKKPCSGQILVKSILQKGQNYHGQFNNGDTLKVYFHFTMNNTSKLFPELNKTLPGLKKGDRFEAEIHEKNDIERSYSIHLYALTN